VPEGATLQSVAEGLTDAINARSTASPISALAIGDRIEIHSMDLKASLTCGTSAGTGTFCTTFVNANGGDFLDRRGLERGRLGITNAILAAGDWLQLDVIKTNGTRVTLSATNFDNAGSPLLVAQSLAINVNNNAMLQEADGMGAQVTVSTNRSSACSLVLQAR